MSDKKKYPATESMEVACHLVEQLGVKCERIEIAGSLRRGKSEVGDIEILYVPRFEKRPDGLFDSKQVDLAEEQIEAMLRGGVLSKRKNIRGCETWGPKNKLAVHVNSGIPVDLFATTEENWWNSLVVRTGSKQMNLELTNAAIARGRSLQAYGVGVLIKSTGEVIASKSEEDVFELCGVPYLKPEDR